MATSTCFHMQKAWRAAWGLIQGHYEELCAMWPSTQPGMQLPRPIPHIFDM